MPSGQHHSIATTSAAAIILDRAFVQLDPGLAFCALGCLSGLVLTCDLDVDTGSISDYRVRATFGRTLGKLWGWYWGPYAHHVEHRSWLSHAPIVGTIVRLIYFVPGWAVLYGIANGNWWAFCFFYGLAVSDFLHWAMDKMV